MGKAKALVDALNAVREKTNPEKQDGHARMPVLIANAMLENIRVRLMALT